jgi:hypothetical protein
MKTKHFVAQRELKVSNVALRATARFPVIHMDDIYCISGVHTFPSFQQPPRKYRRKKGNKKEVHNRDSQILGVTAQTYGDRATFSPVFVHSGCKPYMHTCAQAPTARVNTTACWAKMVASMNVSEGPAASRILVKLLYLRAMGKNRCAKPRDYQRGTSSLHLSTYLLHQSTQLVKEVLDF